MQNEGKNNRPDLGAFSFLKVGVKPSPEGHQDPDDYKKLLQFFLIPLMGFFVIAFIVLYNIFGIGNPPLLIGIFCVIWALFELKTGVALKVIPFSQYFGGYFYFKDENKNMYAFSMAAHFLIGILLMVIGIFF
jgi:hypothetical protein